MTGKERMQLAMQNKQPDRVPVMCQLSFGHILLNTGISPSDFVFNPEYSAEGFWLIMKKYNFDGQLLNPWSNKSEEFRRALRIEKGQDGDMCYLPNGDRIFCPIDDTPREYPQNRVIHPEIDDVETSKIKLELEIPDWKIEAHKILINKSNNEYSIHGEVPAPMDLLVELLGLENMLMGLIIDPEKCKELLEMYVEQTFAFGKAQIQLGVDAVKISSPYVGGGFLSKEHYKNFVVPYEKKLVQKLHSFKPGIPVYTHTCGSIGDRLELMMETEIDGIECLDPAPLGNCDLSEAKSRIGHKLFIKGNMDSVNVLLNATHESIEEYVKKQIQDGAKDGGYILSSACSVSPWVNPEIMKTLVPLAERYGTYPPV